MTDPLGLIPNSTSGVAPGAMGPAAGQGTAGGPSFKDVLMQNIEQVNKLQQDAEMAIEDLNAGRREDYGAVMIATQKADTAFKLLLQVRNKMLDAYDQIQQIRV